MESEVKPNLSSRQKCPSPKIVNLKISASFTVLNHLGKEIEIVHRLSLVRTSYCVGTCRVKQKQKQTKVHCKCDPCKDH